MIESNLNSQQDRNAFICTSPHFALMFDDKLYKHNSPHEHAYVVLWAAQRGLAGTIRKCLKAGAKIPRRDRFRSHLADRDAPESLKVIPRHPKSHPLTAAAAIGSNSCVCLLLKQGVSPNLLDEHYETPMRQAAGNGHVHIVKRLLFHDPSLFEGAFKLRRPLKLAAARGHLPVLKVLFSFLKYGDQSLTVKDAAQIILYEGLWHCKESVVRYALEKGADVNDDNSEFSLRFAPDLRPEDSSEMVSRKRLIQSSKAREIIRGTSTPGWSYEVPNTLHAALIGGDADLIQLIIAHDFEIARVKQIIRDACFRANTELISRMTKFGITLTSKMFHEFLNGADPLWKNFMKTNIDKIEEELCLKP
ncbi:Ankyrin repeat protein [Penicillium digitatum PHI26]|uniref:Ankyrin repeat protein n=3 Tax=Penicillium digitatum TaxID=36651 RepID=K9GVB6_PEND2|nr:Ankyrin repeat protein [Penicillium digitatum Pd1]EKV16357.1 Ankyrin repeat protein [Penicillium digitatum Pd1]EKV18573.1 Ankyrin repeat protein [Penicillium digitatum PHI26]